MEDHSLINMEADMISLIFSFIIAQANNFDDFVNLFMAWVPYQTISYIRYVIAKMDWEKIYELDQQLLPMEVTRDRLHRFINHCVDLNIEQAMFFDSSMKLFRGENVEHHLSILSAQSTRHFPSYFSYLVFKAIYEPSSIDVTVHQMFQIMKNVGLRVKVQDLISLLAAFYETAIKYGLPIYTFCREARNPDPFNVNVWPPIDKDFWYSLCSNTVEEYYEQDEDGVSWGKPLTMNHIFHSSCKYCTMQIIVYKVLVGCVWY